MKSLLKRLFLTLIMPIAFLNAFIDSLEIRSKVAFLYREIYWRFRLASLGDNSEIHPSISVYGSKKVIVGNNVALNSFTHIWGQGGVIIGNNVMIASHVAVISVSHDPNSKCMRTSKIVAPIEIEEDVWIGAHAVILPGIRIGKGSIIGAGAVITKNIPPYSIVVGVPGTIIKTRTVSGNLNDD